MNGWWNLESVFEGLDLTPPKNCPGRLLSVLDAGAVDLSGKPLKVNLLDAIVSPSSPVKSPKKGSKKHSHRHHPRAKDGYSFKDKVSSELLVSQHGRLLQLSKVDQNQKQEWRVPVGFDASMAEVSCASDGRLVMRGRGPIASSSDAQELGSFDMNADGTADHADVKLNVAVADDQFVVTARSGSSFRKLTVLTQGNSLVFKCVSSDEKRQVTQRVKLPFINFSQIMCTATQLENQNAVQVRLEPRFSEEQVEISHESVPVLCI